jgi:hypothetical protein
MEGILSVPVGARIAVRDLGSVAPEDWSAAHATFVYDTVLNNDAAQILEREQGRTGRRLEGTATHRCNSSSLRRQRNVVSS